jgi:hypothetical protein
MKHLKVICRKPTKTLTRAKIYKGLPYRKSKSDGSYNGRWTTSWEQCTVNQATSIRVLDDVGILRYISKKRFLIIIKVS